MADINAVDLTAETLSSLDGTENVVGFDTAEGKKIPISALADYAIQKKTQSLMGATQTPQAAINSLTSNISYNAATATSSNGSFASLCGESGTYAVYVSDTSNNYCYGQFTVVKGSSYKWAMIANSGITLSASNNQGTLVFTGGTGTYTAKVTKQSFVPSNATTEQLNNSSMIGRVGTFAGDVNTLITPGYWYCTSSATNIPSDFTAAHLFVNKVDARLVQIAFQYTGDKIATRTSANSGSTWGSWFYQPTRAEMDALNSNLVKVALTRTSAASRGDGFLIYDPVKKSVRIYASYYNATAISTNSVIFTIPSEYRPPANTNVPCFYQTTSGVSPYMTIIYANGNISNNLGNTTLGGLIVGEYLLE